MNEFAVIVPSEADLTAPIAASIEQSKLFIFAANKLEQLAHQTREVTDDNGNSIIIDHPDLKWWADFERKILTDIAKLNQSAGMKDADLKLDLLKMFMNTDLISKETKEEVAKRLVEERFSVN